MGVLSRFKDIMSANINALLDKAENPEKMIDQYLRNLQDDLGKVKAETASVMAEETRCKRALDECNAEIAKFQNYAVKAVEAGNDDDARQFLTKKNQLLEKQASLQQAYTLAADNAAKMKQMHDKLVGDINELNTKKEAIKAKMAVAKTQERINKIGSSVAGAENNMSAFGRMEAKVDKMLDEANAMAELNDLSANDPTAALAEKYEDKQEATAVDNELAALKASLGK